MKMLSLADVYLTPVYLLFFYGLALAVRAKVTNVYTKKYFLPALTVKFVGAIALGLVYQFYYGGGDTSNYYMSLPSSMRPSTNPSPPDCTYSPQPIIDPIQLSMSRK